MSDHPACLAMVPAGPGLPPGYVQDTVNSITHHMPAGALAVAIIDNTPDGSLRDVRTGRATRLYYPVADIYRFTDVPQSIVGPLLVEQLVVLADARKRFSFDVVLKMDTDALVTGPSPHAQAHRRFLNDPAVGMVGAFRTRGDGSDKAADMDGAGRRLLAEMSLTRGLRRLLRRPRSVECRLLLGRLYRLALRNGYRAGWTVTGGAAFMSRALVDRWCEMGVDRMVGLRHSRLPDDQLFGLCTYAAGFRLEQAPPDLMAVNWIGLPMPPEEVIRRGVKVIHSIKGDDLDDQGRLRDFFARQRAAAPDPA